MAEVVRQEVAHPMNMDEVRLNAAEKPQEMKGKTKKEKSECLNLRKTLLGTSPRLVILKSAESLCIKTFDLGVKREKTKKPPPTVNPASGRLLRSAISESGTSQSSTSSTGPLPAASSQSSPSSLCCINLTAATGLILTILSILSFFWTPFDILMNERLKMVRGLPAYEWWASPPDEVLLRVYLFNITNAQEFLANPKAKLQMEEIGPFIFREKLRHTGVRFHENGTLTYIAHRTAIFLPEMNHLSLNASLTIPNLAVLGMSSYLWDASFLTKLGFIMLQNRLGSEPLINTTVYNYFWNLTDPLLKTTHKWAPSVVPTDNIGILHQIYKDFVDDVTVYMGPGSERRFFTVNQFHGSPRFGYWQNETCDSVEGATEGVTYHQAITKNDTLRYFRKTICRITPLTFAHEMTKMGMKVFKFELPSDIFSRPSDTSTEECFISPGVPDLPSGLTDVSPCYFHFPIAASFPHFLNAETFVQESIGGLSPDKNKHGSFVIVEPHTGVPLESRARSQSNLIVHKVTSFPRVSRFSNTIIPMFWAEYNQVGLPWYISYLMYFSVNILLVTQKYCSCVFLAVGFLLIIRTPVLFVRRKRHCRSDLYSYSSLDLIPPAAGKC